MELWVQRSNNLTVLCATYEVDNYIRSPSTENSTSASTPLTPEEIKVDKIVLSWIFTTLSDPLQARSRTNALKAELHSIKLGDRSIESYFQKVDSIVNILTSLDARVNEEDVIHYVFDGLPKTYNQSKSLTLPVDSSSSSPVVLIAQSGVNRRPTTSQKELLSKILDKLGINSNIATVAPVLTVMPCANVFYHTPSPGPVQQIREHGRMIPELVEHGPLDWPSIEVDGLPKDVYALVNHHRIAKDLWEQVQLLMQGTSLTKQERECRLYDTFDKFSYNKGESLHEYYLRFTQIINDINIYKMSLQQFQVNTKFLNSLPPEWSKFVTDVKLVRDLHTIKFHQLKAYLEQHEIHVNEVRIMRERNQDPLALVASHQNTPSHFNTYQTSYNHPQYSQQVSPSQSPQYGLIHPTQQYSTTYPSTPLVTWQDSAQNQRGKEMLRSSGKKFYWLKHKEMTVITNNAAYQADDLDVYDSDCDDITTAKFSLMANLSHYSLDVLSAIPHSEHTHNDMPNQSVQEMQYSEQTHLVDYPKNEIKKAQLIRPMLYDGIVIAKETNVISIADSEETLMLEEESRSKMLLKQNFGKRFVPQQELSAEQAFWFKMSNLSTDSSDASPVKVDIPSELPKVILVNASLKNIKFHLAQFDFVVKKRITPDALTEGEWEFKHTKAVFINEIIPFLKSLKDIFNAYDKYLLNKITKVQTIFNQMKTIVQQHSMVEKSKLVEDPQGKAVDPTHYRGMVV
ncbi:hypothetical protein Tco_0471221 [Tanacetum coccineum]